MRRIISVLAVAALMAAIMVVNVAPAFAALPWWKDGDKGPYSNPYEMENCTWGKSTGQSVHSTSCRPPS